MADLAPDDQVIAYFGYGSLVNRATHRTEIIGAVRASVRGWRRFWRPRPDMDLGVTTIPPVSLLTAGRRKGAEIEGLLVFDRAAHLPAVDEREARYHRRSLNREDLTVLEGDIPDACALYIYEAFSEYPDYDGEMPILQSYLDAVLQGYLIEHQQKGVERFVAETGAFDTPIVLDRDQPLYPRSVQLSARELDMFEGILRERGVTYVEMSSISAARSPSR